MITRIYRDLKKLNSTKIDEPIKKVDNCTKQNYFKGRNPNDQKNS
jgi:hypothetical protein